MKTKKFKVEVVAYSGNHFHLKATKPSETIEISELLNEATETEFVITVPEKKFEITEQQFSDLLFQAPLTNRQCSELYEYFQKEFFGNQG